MPGAEALAAVVDHLRGGGLVAMPTETVYGFGCVPERKLPWMAPATKGQRGPDKPFLLLIPGIELGSRSSTGSPEARELAEAFWPGALTLILADPRGQLPAGVRSPEGGVAVRVSPHPLAGAVVRALGGPMVSTSANAAGGPPALDRRRGPQDSRGIWGRGMSSGFWTVGNSRPPSLRRSSTAPGPGPVFSGSGPFPLKPPALCPPGDP